MEDYDEVDFHKRRLELNRAYLVGNITEDEHIIQIAALENEMMTEEQEYNDYMDMAEAEALEGDFWSS